MLTATNSSLHSKVSLATSVSYFPINFTFLSRLAVTSTRSSSFLSLVFYYPSCCAEDEITKCRLHTLIRKHAKIKKIIEEEKSLKLASENTINIF